ncbi:putative zn 2cys6 transcription [Phaeomoniella chlamydospora]|uniref:Putative zn 2cys6 transcription n=1 Tax=Phaeomoniella chlamydospora TaxID=158046 RepID=A0A0G2ELK4_PHACM|nr:putative zn 2cys6 transcription [Phaeomoniella chlamydospora]
MAREIAQPWLGLLTQFQIGVTLLYCFYATPPTQWKASYKSADVPDAIRACSSTLAILAERWAEAECVRDIFEIIAREVPVGETWGRPKRMSEGGRRAVEENWKRVSEIVIHRPTMRMIHEIATEDFCDHVSTDFQNISDSAVAHGATIFALDGLDIQWVDSIHDPPENLATHFNSSTSADVFSDEVYFHYS